MSTFDTKKYSIYSSFLNKLAKDLTKFYYANLNKPFKISNKLKGKGYDPEQEQGDTQPALSAYGKTGLTDLGNSFSVLLMAISFIFS